MRILAAIAVLACTCLSAQAKETLYRCAHNSSNEEISLTLKSEDGATTITIGSKNGNRIYFVSETTPGTYRADSKNSEAPEAFSSLELDRFSSELRVQERVSDHEMQRQRRRIGESRVSRFVEEREREPEPCDRDGVRIDVRAIHGIKRLACRLADVEARLLAQPVIE